MAAYAAGPASALADVGTGLVAAVAEASGPAPAPSNLETMDYTFGTPVVGLPGDFYKLCWSHEGGGLEKFNVEIDDVVVLVGPNTLDAECTMGLSCALSLTGHLLEPLSSLLIIPGGDECGSESVSAIARWDANAEAPAMNYIAWDSTAAASVADDEASATYDFGTPVEGQPGPGYKICWSHDSLAAADHVVELGVFTLNGPDTALFTCYIGGECTLTITGYGLDPTNKVVIVYGPYDQLAAEGDDPSGAGCGDGYFNPVSGAGVMPASLSYAATESASEESVYEIGQAFGPVGNFYSLCWAPEPSANIPASLPQFKVTVDRQFELAYPVDDDAVWDEEEGASSASGGFLDRRREDGPATYHDDETNLDLNFAPPHGRA